MASRQQNMLILIHLRVMKNRFYLFSLLWLTASVLLASNHSTVGKLTVSHQQTGFSLFDGQRVAPICVSAKEPVTVRKVAQLFADDVQRVTGIRPRVQSSQSTGSVVIATLGHNAYVDGLVKKGRLDVSAIRGGWEQFVIREVDGRLLIVGSDRRGTAYGVFTLSQEMGVSPWYWWADVPVARRHAVYVDADYTSFAPAVKYRGIFINDEDWGLKPWASKNYEKELGDIGPRTYSRVCELLLRLKANMLAPAMHSCTGAFYSHPESKVVCDSFGIVITTSHCEPLLLNNAAKSEWDSERDGEWNYKTNRETIYKKWDDRLAEASQYENIYTTAMRGVHDEGLRGSLPMSERVPLLEQVISDQRHLMEKHISKKPTEIPQIFVPYKETMDIYENGLRVPDDITLVWVDDNYGYMKRVANPEEQKRSGRSGVYYHLSYLGAPHDYLWLNTTPPVLMYEELRKAYDCGADRYWLLNVGDIKPMELGMQTFFDMAWDMDECPQSSGGCYNFDSSDAYVHQAEFLARTFGGSETTYQAILDDYYRLAWSHKPEYMGWEYQWDDEAHTGLKPTEYSFQHNDEAQRRLADYQRISDEVERLSAMMDEQSASAFFELLQFSVQGAYQMNRKFLMAQLNQELLAQQRYAEANWAAHQMELAYDSINALNRRYNKQLNGKWDGMMALSTSFTPTCQFYQKPTVTYTPGAGEKPMSLVPLRGQVAEGCCVVDLGKPVSASNIVMLRGIGYDGKVVMLGHPAKEVKQGEEETASYEFVVPQHEVDSVDIVFYTVPVWPLYKGKRNRVGISIDNSPVQVFENKFKEYDRTWKDQVMRNGIGCRMRFALDKNLARHKLRLVGDPGQMVQRVIVDWGGLQPSYIGPQL